VSTLVHANISAELNRGGGIFIHSNPNLCAWGLVRRLPEYPGLSLEAVKPVLGPEEIVYTPVQSYESVSVS